MFTSPPPQDWREKIPPHLLPQQPVASSSMPTEAWGERDSIQSPLVLIFFHKKRSEYFEEWLDLFEKSRKNVAVGSTPGILGEVIRFLKSKAFHQVYDTISHSHLGLNGMKLGKECILHL